MSDLITRLRSRYMDTKNMLPCALEHEAADKIERLMVELSSARSTLLDETKAHGKTMGWLRESREEITRLRAAITESMRMASNGPLITAALEQKT